MKNPLRNLRDWRTTRRHRRASIVVIVGEAITGSEQRFGKLVETLASLGDFQVDKIHVDPSGRWVFRLISEPLDEIDREIWMLTATEKLEALRP